MRAARTELYLSRITYTKLQSHTRYSDSELAYELFTYTFLFFLYVRMLHMLLSCVLDKSSLKSFLGILKCM